MANDDRRLIFITGRGFPNLTPEFTGKNGSIRVPFTTTPPFMAWTGHLGMGSLDYRDYPIVFTQRLYYLRHFTSNRNGDVYKPTVVTSKILEFMVGSHGHWSGYLP